MKKTVCVVDDDAGILEVTEIVLRDAGFEVQPIASISDLFIKLEQKLPNIILLDLTVSGENGEDVAKKIKSNFRTKDIPLLIMSADINIEKKAQKAGADSFIKKPYDIYELEKTVKKYIK